MAKAKKIEDHLNEALRVYQVDPAIVEQSVRGAVALQEKLSTIALGAADRSNALVLATAKDAVAEYAKVGQVKGEANDYLAAFVDFTKFATERAAQNLATVSEIATVAQRDAADLLAAAGEQASKDAAAVAQNVANDVTKAVKKAAA